MFIISLKKVLFFFSWIMFTLHKVVIEQYLSACNLTRFLPNWLNYNFNKNIKIRFITFQYRALHTQRYLGIVHWNQLYMWTFVINCGLYKTLAYRIILSNVMYIINHHHTMFQVCLVPLYTIAAHTQTSALAHTHSRCDEMTIKM